VSLEEDPRPLSPTRDPWIPILVTTALCLVVMTVVFLAGGDSTALVPIAGVWGGTCGVLGVLARRPRG
jgi:hypothetical protein